MEGFDLPVPINLGDIGVLNLNARGSRRPVDSNPIRVREALDMFAVSLDHLVRDGSATPTIDQVKALAFGSDEASIIARQRVLGQLDDIINPDGIPQRKGPGPDIGPEWVNPLKGGLTAEDRRRYWDEVAEALRLVIWARRTSGVEAWNDWASRLVVDADGITGLNVKRACVGDKITIIGAFPASQPEHTSVIVGATAADVRDWQPDQITIEVPYATSGCVAFRRADSAEPVVEDGAFAAAASHVSELLSDATFGRGTPTFADLGFVPSVPRNPLPGFYPDNERQHHSYLHIGPSVAGLRINGDNSTATIVGEGQITLTWRTEGAETVTIRVIDGEHELPPLMNGDNLAAEGTLGPIDLRLGGLYPWTGQYELVATNPCAPTPTTSRVTINMREKPPIPGFADCHAHLAGHLAFGGNVVRGQPYPPTPQANSELGLALSLASCQHGLISGFISPDTKVHDPQGWPTFAEWPTHGTRAHQQAHIEWIRRAWQGGMRLIVALAVNNELLPETMGRFVGNPVAPYDDMSAIKRQLDAIRTLVSRAVGPDGEAWMVIASDATEAQAIIASGKLAVVLGVEVDSLGNWHTPGELEAAAAAAQTTPQQLIDTLLDDLWAQGVRYMFPIHGTNNAFGGAAIFNKEYDAVNLLTTGKSFQVETAPENSGITFRLDQTGFSGGDIAESIAYHYKELDRTLVAAIPPLMTVLGGVVGGGAALAGLDPGTAIALLSNPITWLSAAAVMQLVLDFMRLPCPPEPAGWGDVSGGHINAMGMTSHGVYLMEQLTKRGFLVDIDHMGYKTLQTALAMCEQRQYPVFSGHSWFRDLKPGTTPLYPTRPFLRSDPFGAVENYGTSEGGRLGTEADKSADDIERIRRLGGFVAPMTGQGDLRGCGCGPVPNNSSGTSKTFAQVLMYANDRMHRRSVGFGTDVNGFGELPGARFGPEGSPQLAHKWTTFDHVVRRTPGANKENLSTEDRRTEVLAQHHGVRYDTPMTEYREHRFPTYETDPKHPAAFDLEERDLWEALVINAAGLTPQQAIQPAGRAAWRVARIIDMGGGLAAGSRQNTNGTVQTAAYLASHPRAGDADWSGNDPADLVALRIKYGNIVEHFRNMSEWRHSRPKPWSTLYNNAGELTRCRSGIREWDVNVDGVAHYGLLPDFIQDLENIGAPIDVLLRSASDFVDTWARCSSAAAALNP